MTTSNRLGITELAETQNNRSVTVNEAIAKLEAGAFYFPAKSVGDNAPPGSPAEGDLYIVGTAGTGAFSGHNEQIAVYYNAAWLFLPALEGALAYAQDDNSYYRYDGADWVTEAMGSSVSPIGKHTVWIPAGAMIARTSNGAAAGSVETSSNKVMIKTLDFDASADEFAQFSILMPKGWNEGTVSFRPVWSHAATATNFGVAWFCQGLALSDDDAADAAFGTAQSSVDTGGTTNDIYIGPESSAITIGGTPAEGDLVVFQVYRHVADAGDTMAIDARLHGIHVYLTTSAATDA